MSAVVGPEFGKDRLHMALDGVFGDRKVLCDIFIRIPPIQVNRLRFPLTKPRGILPTPDLT
jgi:hypothetical protein